MGFFDLFKQTDNNKENPKPSIFHLLKNEFPNMPEERLMYLACFAGLMARVAYVDLNIEKREVETITHILAGLDGISLKEASLVAQIAVKNMQELSGIENHLYCQELNKILSQKQKYDFLVCLFKVAASDGNADNLESEEIRIMAKEFILDHHTYISARATVKEFLGSLKKE